MLEKASKKNLQKRSYESQNKILDTAEMLFSQKGYKATKIADIIAGSGCSAGSFYHQFKDKRQVFEILYDRYIELMVDSIEEIASEIAGETDIRRMLASVVDRSLNVLEAHVGARAAAEELSRESPEIAERGYRLTDQFLQKIHTGLDQYVAQIKHPEPVRAIEEAFQMVLLVMTQHTFRPRKHFPSDRSSLIEMLVNAACGILKVEEESSK